MAGALATEAHHQGYGQASEEVLQALKVGARSCESFQVEWWQVAHQSVRGFCL